MACVGDRERSTIHPHDPLRSREGLKISFHVIYPFMVFPCNRPLLQMKLAFEVGVAALQSVVFYNTGTLTNDNFRRNLSFVTDRTSNTNDKFRPPLFGCNREIACVYNYVSELYANNADGLQPSFSRIQPNCTQSADHVSIFCFVCWCSSL